MVSSKSRFRYCRERASQRLEVIQIIFSIHSLLNELRKFTFIAKTEKMNALVWNKGRWSLHLFPLLPALQQKIDAAQARYLRRILKLPAAYISRISHKEVRRRCGTYRFSTFIFRAQLRWLGQRTHSAGSCLHPTLRSTPTARLH